MKITTSRHQSLHESVAFYDQLVCVNACVDRSLVKNAENPIPGIANALKTYFGARIDPARPTASIVNILVPGIIKAMVGGPLGWIIAGALSVFGVDFSALIMSVWDRLKGSVAGDKPTQPSSVDSAVDAAVSGLEAESTTHNLGLEKTALLGLSRSKNVNMFSAILKWVFKIILSSAGLLVAGDIINKTIGRPNALDGTIQDGHPVERNNGPAPSAHTSTQTKFKINPGYSNVTQPQPWTVGIVNNESNISNLLVNFAKEVYSGLDGLEGKIKSSPAFETVKDAVVWSNNDTTGDNLVFIPKVFTSKKQLVDFFIDDVAKSV